MPKTVRLPESRAWLRLADPDWTDPLDPSHAQRDGGRWNPPGSFPTLYLSGDIVTARLQIERLLAGSPVGVDDLDDGAFELLAVTLPRAQACADAVSPGGLRSLHLPQSYPREPSGEGVPHHVCQRLGEQIHLEGLRGVWCRSACTPDGGGRELAWFPATRRSRAKAIWDSPRPLGSWKDATGWADLGLEEQADPA